MQKQLRVRGGGAATGHRSRGATDWKGPLLSFGPEGTRAHSLGNDTGERCREVAQAGTRLWFPWPKPQRKSLERPPPKPTQEPAEPPSVAAHRRKTNIQSLPRAQIRGELTRGSSSSSRDPTLPVPPHPTCHTPPKMPNPPRLQNLPGLCARRPPPPGPAVFVNKPITWPQQPGPLHPCTPAPAVPAGSPTRSPPASPKPDLPPRTGDAARELERGDPRSLAAVQ